MKYMAIFDDGFLQYFRRDDNGMTLVVNDKDGLTRAVRLRPLPQLQAKTIEDHIVRDCRTCANREVTAYHKEHGEFGWCDFVDFELQEDDFCSKWKAKE